MPAKPAAEPATVSLESLVKESVAAKKEPKASKASHAPRPHAAPARPAKGPDIGIKGSIPKGYVPSDTRRMDAYRRISRAGTRTRTRRQPIASHRT